MCVQRSRKHNRNWFTSCRAAPEQGRLARSMCECVRFKPSARLFARSFNRTSLRECPYTRVILTAFTSVCLRAHVCVCACVRTRTAITRTDTREPKGGRSVTYRSEKKMPESFRALLTRFGFLQVLARLRIFRSAICFYIFSSLFICKFGRRETKGCSHGLCDFPGFCILFVSRLAARRRNRSLSLSLSFLPPACVVLTTVLCGQDQDTRRLREKERDREIYREGER